jgi:trans-2,3-dihydro-3-hydroxyanthranilate isomerase
MVDSVTSEQGGEGMIEFVTVDVFTDRQFGGNPLAVIPDARGLADDRLQLIAREFNYSETTFVFPPDDPAHTARVRIFTPTDEIPFAGHPNVGTAFALGRRGTAFGTPFGDDMVFEENAGLVKISLLHDGNEVVGASFIAPQGLSIGDEVDVQTIADCIALTPGDIAIGAHAPRIVSVGLPIVVTELVDLDALAAARPVVSAFEKAGAAHWHRGDRFSTYLYVRNGSDTNRLRARMFAPLSNIPEDPATGSAAAALGAYLGSLDPNQDARNTTAIEQGVEMGRRSLIDVEVRKLHGAVDTVRVGGRCAPVMQGRIAV